jgi:hypothetical protein
LLLTKSLNLLIPGIGCAGAPVYLPRAYRLLEWWITEWERHLPQRRALAADRCDRRSAVPLATTVRDVKIMFAKVGVASSRERVAQPFADQCHDHVTPSTLRIEGQKAGRGLAAVSECVAGKSLLPGPRPADS